MWFWCSIASVALVGGTVLALLGPPAEQAMPQPTAANPAAPEPAAPEQAAARTQPGAGAPARAALAPVKPPTRRAADVSAQPETPVMAPASPPSAPVPGTIVQQEASPRGRAAVVLHPARGEGGAALADRLAARAGIAAGRVSVGEVGEERSEAAIRFYSESDHELARRIGRELGGMGYTWKLQNYSQRSGVPRDGAIEVWLSNR